MSPRLSWSRPWLSQLHFLPLFPWVYSTHPLWSACYSANTHACSHFNNFALTLPSTWNVLSLNSHTTPFLNYSNPYSNLPIAQENFLNHPIQNSTYIHLNFSLSSCPYYFFTIRVSNWCHVCLLSEPHSHFKIHKTGTLFKWLLYPQYLQTYPAWRTHSEAFVEWRQVVYWVVHTKCCAKVKCGQIVEKKLSKDLKHKRYLDGEAANLFWPG